ncbi:MAG: 6-carboxytetrahydropterin synthase [Planctomycetes bacterium]|nr:6-carboxytetrahydropterin synthase [Planctomycetota bacterium]
MLDITRRVEFAAAHRLHRPDLSDAANARLYGPCAHKGGHGHNYVLEVTLRGQVDPATGMVIDLKELKAVMEREVVAKCDHRNLNLDPDFLRGVIPTAENVAVGCWRVLERRLPAGLLHRVRLYESPRKFVDFYGASAPRNAGVPLAGAAANGAVRTPPGATPQSRRPRGVR